MAESYHRRVCSAELFRNGIIITFADGKSALFSADFLYASLPQAQELIDQDDDEPDNPGGAAGDASRR
jgi:hypothetical protein